jgi:cell shape-determining protein MreC
MDTLEREVIELEQQNAFLSTFKDKFMVSEDEIKLLNKQIYQMEQEKNKMLAVVEENGKLQH